MEKKKKVLHLRNLKYISEETELKKIHKKLKNNYAGLMVNVKVV